MSLLLVNGYYRFECFDCGDQYAVQDNQDIERALRHRCKMKPRFIPARLAWIITQVVND